MIGEIGETGGPGAPSHASLDSRQPVPGMSPTSGRTISVLLGGNVLEMPGGEVAALVTMADSAKAYLRRRSESRSHHTATVGEFQKVDD